MQKSIEELKQLAEESGIMLTPEMTKSEIIKNSFNKGESKTPFTNKGG